MAAGLATLYELDASGLVERSAVRGRRLLELTEPLVERYEVVREVRGLGLIWAIEFGEPVSHRGQYRLIERLQPGLFAQFVVGPLFGEHRILSQVAGHAIPVVKALPSLTVSDEDLDWFAGALDETITKAQRVPRAAAGFALSAARLR
jgi:ornithine--oxo-acid transaminase